jgi:hypothetical protein
MGFSTGCVTFLSCVFIYLFIIYDMQWHIDLFQIPDCIDRGGVWNNQHKACAFHSTEAIDKKN